jgi:hypothetical protein
MFSGVLIVNCSGAGERFSTQDQKLSTGDNKNKNTTIWASPVPDYCLKRGRKANKTHFYRSVNCQIWWKLLKSSSNKDHHTHISIYFPWSTSEPRAGVHLVQTLVFAPNNKCLLLKKEEQYKREPFSWLTELKCKKHCLLVEIGRDNKRVFHPVKHHIHQ